MIGKRLAVANRVAKKVFHKYHIQNMADHYYENVSKGMIYPPEGAYRKTKVFCSDPLCCGNPRRMKHRYMPTMQERKVDAYEKFDLEEDTAVSPSW
jgi:hypothetical protein